MSDLKGSDSEMVPDKKKKNPNIIVFWVWKQMKLSHIPEAAI